MTVFGIFGEYGEQLLGGFWVTLKLAMVAYALGFFMGIPIGILAGKYSSTVRLASKVTSVILSSVPILVFLFWLHYPLQYFLGIVVDPFITGCIALSLIMIFLVADATSEAITRFPRAYSESAKLIGLSEFESVVKVQFPIVFRELLPTYILIMILMLQSTIFTSLISVEELFRVCQQINSEIYQPVTIYTALATFFLVVCGLMTLLSAYLKSRIRWS